jgi:hypothetical protein
MKAYRQVRRKVNARLVKAAKAGRLADELGRLERKAAVWSARNRAPAKSRRRTAN